MCFILFFSCYYKNHVYVYTFLFKVFNYIIIIILQFTSFYYAEQLKFLIIITSTLKYDVCKYCVHNVILLNLIYVYAKN